MPKIIFLIAICMLIVNSAYAEQSITDFYLSNYKEDGTRDWEVKGQEAYIYDEHVDIDKMQAKYFSPEDTISVTSKKAKMDKANMDVYLREDVKIENKEGMELLTDSLDWKRSDNTIKTDDWVEAKQNSMNIKAKGLTADTEFKRADFEQDVAVSLPMKDGQGAIQVNCVGPLEIEYQEGRAIFHNNVVIDSEEGKMFCDKATVYFDMAGKKIDRFVCEGSVKIVKDENVTFAEKATYWGETQKLVLEGSPRLIYFHKTDETS